jgi:hypothetical protein
MGSSSSPKKSATLGGEQPKSAMIEAEKAQLELIKQRQQKEIEKMLGAEFTRQETEKRNAEKQQHEMIKQH